jgi:Tfp pilus assembly protein PilN
VERLQLDFLHPDGGRFPVGKLLLVFGVLAALMMAWKFNALANEQVQLQAQITNTERLLRRELPQVHTDDKQLSEQVARANIVLAALNLPWDAMFAELESVAEENVALLSIQPDAAGKHIRLAGEARRYEDVLAYVKRLERTVGFANVFLLGHEGRDEGGVSFNLGADWAGQ